MLSRDADACFWIGRYVERAEATARMVDVHYHAALETVLPVTSSEGEESGSVHWEVILAISGGADTFRARYNSANDRDVIHFFAFDADNPNSILAIWKAARENARSIREQIASEMWESLNISYLHLREWDIDRVMAASPHEFFQTVKNASHLLQGILNRTMLMSETRDWLDTGRFLERASQTARLLDIQYHDLLPNGGANTSNKREPSIGQEANKANGNAEPLDIEGPLDMHSWIAVLKSVSAYEMYRKTYRNGIDPARIVDFLVLNPQFPASVRHCAARVESCLRRISGNQREEPGNEPERLIGRLRADLTYTRPEEIIQGGLHAFLEGVQQRCAAIGNAITSTYLSY